MNFQLGDKRMKLNEHISPTAGLVTIAILMLLLCVAMKGWT